ncbi:MAG: ankyrin repeat domain-containing protein [Alphaproteobacteria bacterium]|nr:ankyrin repeat domain-containing protein [Alphaproteobacteria bacterium]OJV13471.1 MAG: hypothetical protein BGO27_04590 [Alphaproteobacteria bacterium 33-17]
MALNKNNTKKRKDFNKLLGKSSDYSVLNYFVNNLISQYKLNLQASTDPGFVSFVNQLMCSKFNSLLRITEGFESPLHLAVSLNNPEWVNTLLKNGADPNSRLSTHNNTPLHLACEKIPDENTLKIIRLLLTNKAYPNLMNILSQMPIQVLAHNITINKLELSEKMEEIFELLINSKAEYLQTGYKIDFSSSPFRMAACRKHINLLKYLINNKLYSEKVLKDTISATNDFETLLVISTYSENFDLGKIILKDRVIRNDNLPMLLLKACYKANLCKKGEYSAVELLLALREMQTHFNKDLMFSNTFHFMKINLDPYILGSVTKEDANKTAKNICNELNEIYNQFQNVYTAITLIPNDNIIISSLYSISSIFKSMIRKPNLSPNEHIYSNHKVKDAIKIEYDLGNTALVCKQDFVGSFLQKAEPDLPNEICYRIMAMTEENLSSNNLAFVDRVISTRSAQIYKSLSD